MISHFRYSLFTVLKVLNQKNDFGPDSDFLFKFISTSSVECKPGTLFVPLKDKRDGHDFIPDAISRGADYFLCEKGNPILQKLSESDKRKAILVKDGLISLGMLAHFHKNRFSPLIIAVTGSSGKTTTKELIGNLFQFLPKSSLVVTEKNYNNEIGVPFTLFRITESTQVVVCEMGMNHRGEIARLSRIANPNISLITNIGSAHIEYLKKPENIALEKADITEGMDESGMLFLPEDASYLGEVKTYLKKKKKNLILWKQSEKSDLKILKKSKDGFLLSYRGNQVHWKIPGITLLSNVRGMLAIGEYLKLPEAHLVKAIETYRSPDKRLNIQKKHYTIINDTYNANPESMESSILASVQIASGKPLVWVLGTMKELGKYSKHYHRKVGTVLKDFPEGILLTYGKDAREIANARKIGFNLSFDETENDRILLVKWIKEHASKGTVILVKGSRSMKMETLVADWEE
ncbi:UDP-N-acetylmuramoyl-tripeptide--D-alanyl-D-alanine ligase [Leptospira kobayashii]|uniref:UDP-N-acetylmuramoyl-tripeptide--D-alanyl-D-alanine ligase n=1 Tax=Leptospira kobayashii TaxID=1917830 RepID=A0ABM7UJ95_9LEPT|nr:UDP-N-acetylmuramoyl-tripeptide--D-alanyl-D-alanine ligase [Leptospira kobayashii]BDA78835.1 UDP-N-acetylmuramoyl-tripeptide--D-alanyl-D-alanine ligase [Leptospira kobayashii]